MKKIQLTARTHKGKNKLREAGTRVWLIMDEKEDCQCLKNRPGFHVIPETLNLNQSRWIQQTDDFNFEWSPLA